MKRTFVDEQLRILKDSRLKSSRLQKLAVSEKKPQKDVRIRQKRAMSADNNTFTVDSRDAQQQHKGVVVRNGHDYALRQKQADTSPLGAVAQLLTQELLKAKKKPPEVAQ